MNKRKGVQISEAWVPDALCSSWAVDKCSWSHERIMHEGEKFKTWHLMNAVPRKDFYHAWQNWCLKAMDKPQVWKKPAEYARPTPMEAPQPIQRTPEERARVAQMAQMVRDTAKAIAPPARYVREAPRAGYADRVQADLERRRIQKEGGAT